MTAIKQSRNAREGRFLGLSRAGKLLRVCPAGSDFKEAFEGWHIKLLAERNGLDVASVGAFYRIHASKQFTKEAAHAAFAHLAPKK